MDIHNKLIHAATAYDRKQANGKRYNPYALAQYFQRIEQVEADIAKGGNVREALIRAFSDRLLDALLKSVNEPPHTKAEKNSRFYYEPVND